jgi:hypothetical protein
VALATLYSIVPRAAEPTQAPPGRKSLRIVAAGQGSTARPSTRRLHLAFGRFGEGIYSFPPSHAVERFPSISVDDRRSVGHRRSAQDHDREDQGRSRRIHHQADSCRAVREDAPRPRQAGLRNQVEAVWPLLARPPIHYVPQNSRSRALTRLPHTLRCFGSIPFTGQKPEEFVWSV